MGRKTTKNLRIREHPIIEYDYQKSKKVTIIVNGKKMTAYEGEPIAAALVASGLKVFRRTLKMHNPRGIYCAIGRCTDCIMNVDGHPSIRTCVTPVKEGMVIKEQNILDLGK